LKKDIDADYLLVGGGLQNALILLALAARKPEASIILLERDNALGGNHIWSFQALDLPESAHLWASPLVEYAWPGYQLHFDGSSRWVQGSYRSCSSEHLDRVVRGVAGQRENIRIHTGIAVVRCDASSATLASGEILRGRIVVDARGPERCPARASGGFQKFVGLECSLRQTTAMKAPILMDSRCNQQDGFRFHYILPFTEDRVLIEDTYFSNNPDIDIETLRKGILDDAPRLGLNVDRVLRTEVGVLPMPSRSAFSAKPHGPIHAGYAGGWFNPGTGYSLAAASRLAEHLSQTAIDDTFGPGWRTLVRRMRIQSHFLAFLNLLMFGFFHDASRRRLMERFYMVPDEVVHRFFAMESTAVDMWRVMYVGAPWTPKGWAKRAETAADVGGRTRELSSATNRTPPD
jgi:lycopene beta-cyclase